MSQYVKTSNQEMIWNIFRKIPEVTQYTESEQSSLFTNAISHFYHKLNPNMNLSRDQLQDINKQTLIFLLDQVQKTPIMEQKPQQQQQQQQHYETADQKIQRIFAEKQKMYDNMTAKPVVPKPSELFQEPVMDDDGAIDNMDERLSRMLEERSKDVQEYGQEEYNTQPEYHKNKPSNELLQNLIERVERIEKMLSARMP